MRNRLGTFVLFTVFATSLAGGWFGSRVNAGSPIEEDTQQLLKTFTSVLHALETHYYRETSSEELVENAVRGMLRTLDPHSSFFATADYNRLQEEQRGKYHGLGITIRAVAPGSGRVVVVEPPSPGTPAYKVGLRIGDVISRIEGELIDDWDLNEEVIPNLKGPKGTTVRITVERPGEPEPLELVVERDEIPLYTIRYVFHLQPGIGYLKIDKFSETTSRELDQALEELGQDQLKGLLLDLRDNPGGSLAAAIEVADRFLDRNQVIVSTRGRRGNEQPYRTRQGKRYDYPMVVLINHSSASASEIVAGALQDHDRALIVGETSFGKALVQTIYPLDGNRGLALTTGKYYTPSDRLIQRDYSSGFYDYFYSRRPGRAPAGAPHQTDSGRPVFSGGGIAPDVQVSMDPYSRLARIIDRGNLFYQFVERLVEGRIQSDQQLPEISEESIKAEQKSPAQELEITEGTLDLFREFLLEQELEHSAEAFQESRTQLRNRLKQELFLKYFGEREGYRVALEIDTQVQSALGLLPQAEDLVKNSVANRH